MEEEPSNVYAGHLPENILKDLVPMGICSAEMNVTGGHLIRDGISALELELEKRASESRVLRSCIGVLEDGEEHADYEHIDFNRVPSGAKYFADFNIRASSLAVSPCPRYPDEKSFKGTVTIEFIAYKQK